MRRKRQIAAIIFSVLDQDIRDRKGVGNEWKSIDDDVMHQEIKPTWLRLIKEVLDAEED
jgi:hypothetical protein